MNRLMPWLSVLLLFWAVQWACTLTIYASETEIKISEPVLKALFITNFAKAVKWPESKFPEVKADGSKMTLIIGIIGEDAITPILQGIQGQTVQGRQVEVRQFGSAQAARIAHVIYIGASERSHQSEILRTLQGAEVLTVGEGDDFLPSGGIIQLRLKEKRVVFVVNNTAAREQQIQISSQLLKLAQNVE